MAGTRRTYGPGLVDRDGVERHGMDALAEVARIAAIGQQMERLPSRWTVVADGWDDQGYRTWVVLDPDGYIQGSGSDLAQVILDALDESPVTLGAGQVGGNASPQVQGPCDCPGRDFGGHLVGCPRREATPFA